jgi:hypothetical protein
MSRPAAISVGFARPASFNERNDPVEQVANFCFNARQHSRRHAIVGAGHREN